MKRFFSVFSLHASSQNRHESRLFSFRWRGIHQLNREQTVVYFYTLYTRFSVFFLLSCWPMKICISIIPLVDCVCSAVPYLRCRETSSSKIFVALLELCHPSEISRPSASHVFSVCLCVCVAQLIMCDTEHTQRFPYHFFCLLSLDERFCYKKCLSATTKISFFFFVRFYASTLYKSLVFPDSNIYVDRILVRR